MSLKNKKAAMGIAAFGTFALCFRSSGIWMRARRRGRYRKPITESKAKSAGGAERHRLPKCHCLARIVKSQHGDQQASVHGVSASSPSPTLKLAKSLQDRLVTGKTMLRAQRRRTVACGTQLHRRTRSRYGTAALDPSSMQVVTAKVCTQQKVSRSNRTANRCVTGMAYAFRLGLHEYIASASDLSGHRRIRSRIQDTNCSG